MSPASGLKDPTVLVERREAGVGVGLQESGVGAQMRTRVLALAIG